MLDENEQLQQPGTREPTTSPAFSLVDRRSLLGAIALIITGFILSDMLLQYLAAASSSGALSRSRLWWEIVLNLQVLSAAMVWFCYSDRIDGSEGRIKKLQIVRRWFAIITVLLPSMLGLLGIQQNWFVEQPPTSYVWTFACLVMLFWLAGLLVHYMVQRTRTNKPKPASFIYRLLFLLPAISLVIITLLDAPFGGQIWLLAIPILIYIQGAMPFITKAFGLR